MMAQTFRRILVTGSRGFIGQNIVFRLSERGDIDVLRFDRSDDISKLPELIAVADAVVHLAGENRPENEHAFSVGNTELTQTLCDIVLAEHKRRGRHVPIILASSIQAERHNPYGRSKLAAEEAVRSLSENTGNPVVVFRLPGIFGKWCRPNYNSVVATFCYNIAHDLPIRINDPTASLRLSYVDDLADVLLLALDQPSEGMKFIEVYPEYQITLGELADLLGEFEAGRKELRVGRVGTGLVRALYATYLSYLPPSRFAYKVPLHGDARGVFVEMLKTTDSGQFSYFTAHPGITRGGHYHHTKSEKFLVIQGEALFRFRQLLTNETVEIKTSGVAPQVVETIPGWSHDVTNTGSTDLVVMLWANEVFDHDRPDTVANKV